MTPKHKAEELICHYEKATGYKIDGINGWILKNLAEICVNEILESLVNATGHLTLKRNDLLELESDFCFWRNVRKEINNLK